jgi:UDP-glucose 4-epimerase
LFSAAENLCFEDAGLGEAHVPESHLIPRVVLPFIDIAPEIRAALNLGQGFKIYGDDYPTRDGTAVRDYLHVLDLADAHVRALEYLLGDGSSEIFNLGSGAGYSVREVIQAVRDVLAQTDFAPETVSRREGDPASLVASSEKSKRVLGWMPQRDVAEMIRSAAAWHRSARYRNAVLEKI